MRFLSLPSEIRNQIYEYALVKSEPINLCPSVEGRYENMVNLFDNSTALERHFRLFKNVYLPSELMTRFTKFDGRPALFRLQRDLFYIRKKLAVGLLRTCRQIYSEAAAYFWAGNLWKFEQDYDWRILLRFLLTIGPRPRSHIRHLAVPAPMPEHLLAMHYPVSERETAKNHPKLHMTKAPHAWTHTAFKAVFKLFMQERSLESIDFLVPASFYAGGFDPFQFLRAPWNQGHATKMILPKGFLPKVKVIIEPSDYFGSGSDDQGFPY